MNGDDFLDFLMKLSLFNSRWPSVLVIGKGALQICPKGSFSSSAAFLLKGVPEILRDGNDNTILIAWVTKVDVILLEAAMDFFASD